MFLNLKAYNMTLELSTKKDQKRLKTAYRNLLVEAYNLTDNDRLQKRKLIEARSILNQIKDKDFLKTVV